MDKALLKRMDAVRSLAQEDSIYKRMLEDMSSMEQKYFSVLGTLSSDQQDIICDFVSQCEEMSYRMLEIACTLMHFPSNVDRDDS